MPWVTILVPLRVFQKFPLLIQPQQHQVHQRQKPLRKKLLIMKRRWVMTCKLRQQNCAVCQRKLKLLQSIHNNGDLIPTLRQDHSHKVLCDQAILMQVSLSCWSSSSGTLDIIFHSPIIYINLFLSPSSTIESTRKTQSKLKPYFWLECRFWKVLNWNED